MEISLQIFMIGIKSRFSVKNLLSMKTIKKKGKLKKKQ